MGVEDGLVDMDVFLLAEIVDGLVLGMVLLPLGQALTGSQTGLFLVLEALQPLQVALVLVLSLGLVLSLLRVVLPKLFEEGERVNGCILSAFFFSCSWENRCIPFGQEESKLGGSSG